MANQPPPPSPEYVIPTPNALNKYNLNRYVRSTSHNGEKDNPFVTVSGKAAMQPGKFDKDNNFFLNEVLLEVFEYQTVRIVTNKTDGGLIQASLDYGAGSASNAPNILASFRLLIDKDDVEVIHGEHKWSDPAPSVFNGFYNMVNNVAGTAGMVINMASNALTRAGAEGAYRSAPLQRLDYQKVYENTEPPKINITFTAFTNDNFIVDIYTPIMVLSAFTYPKRDLGGSTGSGGGNTNGFLQKALNAGKVFADDATGLTAAAAQEINEAMALTARQYTFKSPCLFNLYHQSGLFSYSNCMCTNMSIKYEGPWYNSSINEQALYDGFANGPLAMNVSRRSFPTIAKVTMSFQTGERVMRDDFEYNMRNFTANLDTGNTTFTQFGNTNTKPKTKS